ncbi:MAG: hypothetical protein ABIH59_02215 [archaeon]
MVKKRIFFSSLLFCILLLLSIVSATDSVPSLFGKLSPTGKFIVKNPIEIQEVQEDSELSGNTLDESSSVVVFEAVSCTDSDGVDYTIKGLVLMDGEEYPDYCEGNFVVDYSCPLDDEKDLNFFANMIRMIGNVVAGEGPDENLFDCRELGGMFSCVEGACVDVKECAPDETRSCGSDVGECVAGVQYCVGKGFWDDSCEGEIQEGIEICDLLDNDCDEQIDEGGVCGENATASSIGPEQSSEIIDCYDSDGFDFYTQGFVAYINPEAYPDEDMVFATRWPSYYIGEVYQDYCDLIDGEIKLIEYTCGGIRYDYDIRVTSDEGNLDMDYEYLAEKIDRIIEPKIKENEFPAPKEDINPEVTRPRPTSDLFVEQSCTYGCSNGRCLRTPLEIIQNENAYVWASPDTREGYISFYCDALAESVGVDSLTLSIVAEDAFGEEVVSYEQNIFCSGSERCHLPQEENYEGKIISTYYISGEDIEGFWEAYPGKWTFSCSAFAGGWTYEAKESLVIETIDCSESFCPPVQHLALVPLDGTDLFMMQYDARSGTNELRNIEIEFERAPLGGDPSDLVPFSSFDVDCFHDICSYYGIFEGEGIYRSTVTIYDHEGSSYSKTGILEVSL